MKKRTIALLMAVVMLFGATVGTTIAWLTSLSATVTNTMTVGDVEITLDETDVDLGGQPDASSTSRVIENDYKLYPGKTYIKDPVVHVDAASENCFVFVKIENGLVLNGVTIEAATGEVEGYETIAEQMEDNGWLPVEAGSNVYYYAGDKADPTDGFVTGGEDLTVFENFAISKNVNGETLATYEDKTITIKAYAIQAEGFEDALDAWANAPTDWED